MEEGVGVMKDVDVLVANVDGLEVVDEAVEEVVVEEGLDVELVVEEVVAAVEDVVVDVTFVEGFDVEDDEALELEAGDDTNWYTFMRLLPPQISVGLPMHVDMQPSALAMASSAIELPQ